MRLIITITCALFAQSLMALPGAVISANSMYHNVLSRCPERIWPGLTWNNAGFVLFSPSTQKAWEIRGGVGATEPLELAYAALAEEFLAIPHFRIVHNGEGSTAFVNVDNLNRSEDEPGAVAVHELFHETEQRGWRMVVDARGDLYPLLSGPRVTRAMLLEDLKAGRLGAAAARFQHWRETWPEEDRLNTDGREGTARYVEQRALILNELGCEASEDAVLKRAEEWIQSLSLATESDLDLEGYLLGAVAAFRLDKENPDWRITSHEGITPLELLLRERVQTEVPPVDPAFESTVSARLDRSQFRLEMLLEPALAELNHAGSVRVVIPRTARNLGYADYVLRADPSLTARLQLNARTERVFEDPRGEEFVAFGPYAVRFAASQTPCGPDLYTFIVLPRENLSTDGRRFAGRSEMIDFNLSGHLVEAGGHTYLCPSEH